MNFRFAYLCFFLVFGLSAQAVQINVNHPIERYDLAAGVDCYRVGPVEIGAKYRVELASEAFAAHPSVRFLSGGSTSISTNYYWEGIALETYLHFEFNSVNAGHLAIGNLSVLEQACAPANAESAVSPISTTINDNAEELVGSIFSNQSCFQTANHTYSGFYGLLGNLTDTISQLGTFSNGLSSTGIDQGIIMTTGRVSRAPGPNNFTGTTQIYNTSSSDPDLIQLSGSNQLFDVVIVEFDFTPTTDFINFNYIFASEEYCEEITNNTVDVFAFLISGPGISGPFSNGAENIAVLPDGSSIDVTQINHTTNTAFYRSNIPDSFNESCQTSPPVAPNDIEYDGMTTVLTAESPVIPCETYRLKLIIADVGDPFYDSAVFLEAGSFSAGLINVSEPRVTAQNGGAANAAIEGCSDGTLIFSRLDSNDISQPLTVYFNISPTSTATFGLDYTMPADSFIIEAGQFSDTLLIDIFGDALNEGSESIVLRIDNTCDCSSNTTEFLIVDPTPLQLQLSDPGTACQGTPIDLIPTVNGGAGEYDFSWSNGSTDSVLSTVYTPGDSFYILTVTDACQQVASDTISLTAPQITATISGSYALCSGGSVVVPVILSGATSYEIVVNENGSLINYSGGPDTIFLTYSSPQSISLVSVNGDNCPGQSSGNAVISQPDFGLTATVNPVACFGEASGSIALLISGNPVDYQFDWGDPTVTGTNPTGLTAANYALSITDSNGCTLDTFFVITQPFAALSVGLQSSQGQDCSQAGSAVLNISGGTGNYVIDWGDGGAMTFQRNDLIGGQNYSVSVFDENNCTTSIMVTIADDRRIMDATIGSQAGLELSCANPQLNLGAAFNSGPVSYRWRDQNGLLISVTDSVVVGQAGTYSLVVVDPSSSCLDSQSVVVTQSSDFLTLETGGPHLLDCNDSSITITATTPSFSGPVNYSWVDPSGTVISSVDSISGISTAGNYQLTAERVDNGCISTATVIVTEDFQAPALELLLSPLSCSVDTATLLVQNPASSYQYNWSSQNGTISGDVNTASLRVLSAGTYQLRATDPANGCFLDTLVEMNRLGDSLVASAGPDISLDCETQMAIISGSSSPFLSGTGYRWLDDAGLEISDQRELEVTAAGNYTLEVTHPVSGCVSSDVIRVQNDGPASVLYTLLPAPCVEIGATLTINEVVGGLPPYRYFYDGEAVILNDSSAISGLADGSHTLTVEDANGCRQNVPLLLFEPRTFEGEATAISIRLGEGAELGFSTNRDDDIVLISWSGSDELSCVNCSNPIIELPLTSFTARVQLIDDEGCELFLNQEVFVDRRELVYAPTAFSPGILDGINDKFSLFGDSRFVTNVDYLRIFDRWGGMIWSNTNFQVNDERAGWDGTNNGEALSGNAYVFSALVTYFDGTQEIISGNINIIR